MIYMIDSDAVTLAAANSTKGAIGTIKLVNGFYNPPTSGVNAVIYAVVIATVSGTPAGPLFWNAISGSVLTNAATGTIRSAYIGVGAGQSQMTPEVNVTLTQASGTPNFLQLGVIGGPAAIAAGAGNNSLFVPYFLQPQFYYYIVPPGTTFGIAATGAGTTHIVQTTMYWDEVPA